MLVVNDEINLNIIFLEVVLDTINALSMIEALQKRHNIKSMHISKLLSKLSEARKKITIEEYDYKSARYC